MRSRLLITDLDGTLLDRSLRLDPRDVEAALRAKAAGTMIGVATGRMYRSGLPYAQQLETSLPLICYQGALIQELPGEAGPGPVLLRREVPPEVALPVLELARRRGYAVNVYQDDNLLVDAITPDVEFYVGISQIGAVVAKDPPLEERLQQGTTKLTVVVADPERFLRAMAEIVELIGERAEVTRSLVGFCEITAKDVNKGAAVLWLCQHLGADPAQVIVMGDAPNDLSMLAVAGSPVAVEGASQDVLAAAEWVAPGPGGGGLAAVVSHYQLDRSPLD
ncbi:MAG: Cof-type HAD-IIB family hydrolase [Candidatus Dormibacteria bacterium]